MDTPFFIYFSKNFEIKFLTFSLNSLLKILIEIVTQPGTLRVLEKIGVKNNDGLEINKWYPNMEKTFTGWEKFGRVQFKEEKSQITINLGKGSGLEIFNQRIKQINVKQGDIHHGKNK